MKLSKELGIEFLEKEKDNVRTAGELQKLFREGISPERIFSDMTMHKIPARKKPEKSVFEELEVREI